MAKKIEKTKNDLTDLLAADIANDLNKEFEKSLGQVAYVGGGENPSDILEWLSTGSDMLDLAISNRPNGGLPVGRIIEITGWEASGKSLLAASICAKTQELGGLAVYFDTEAAIFDEFFQMIGVNTEKGWMKLEMNKLEDIFTAIEKIITIARAKDSKKLVTIVIDSVMGATTKVEDASTHDKTGYNTAKAIILSQAMRKITMLIKKERIILVLTNQLRIALGVTFGDNATTSGGKAIGFHSSVRLRLKSLQKITTNKTDPNAICGIKTEIKIMKNRVGPPHKAITSDIYFDSGMDNYGSWLETMKLYNIVSQSGAWYTYDFNGTDVKFQSKTFVKKLDEIEGLKDDIYKKICDAFIMKYKPNVDGGIDDIGLEDIHDEESGDTKKKDTKKLV